MRFTRLRAILGLLAILPAAVSVLFADQVADRVGVSSNIITVCCLVVVVIVALVFLREPIREFERERSNFSKAMRDAEAAQESEVVPKDRGGMG
ncbi:MAG TPA: hypothetical protein VG942_06675, partial [Hyphomonadaceae bacterium]|nr:hypothetical protein [Hyphomonadaceae bacterium]